MSLQETIIIDILERKPTLDPRLPKFYSNMINQYNTDPITAFVRSVVNDHYQLANYFINKIIQQLSTDKYYEVYNVKIKALKAVIKVNIANTLSSLKSIEYLLKLPTVYEDDIKHLIDTGLTFSVRFRQYDLAYWFVGQGADPNEGMDAAVEINNLNLIYYFIEVGANDWNLGLLTASREGNMDLILFFIGFGADDWNNAMFEAIEVADMNLVLFFIERGANDWNFALLEAIESNNREMVQFFINQGANNWNKGLLVAIENNNLMFVELMVDLGATNLQEGLESSGNNLQLVKYFVEKLGVNANLEVPLVNALKSGDRSIINFILENERRLQLEPIYVLGPAMRELVSKMILGVNGHDYSDMFIMLNTYGYIYGRDLLDIFYYLYLYQNNLVTNHKTFIVDDVLRHIFTDFPALLAIQKIDEIGIYLKPNIEGLNTMSLLERDEDQLFLSFWDLIIAVNTKEDQSRNPIYRAQSFLHQMEKEYYLLQGLINSYKL